MGRRPDYADLGGEAARMRSAYDEFPATCDDPRVAVMLVCSAALYRAYPALFVIGLAVAGARRFRTHLVKEKHHV